MLLKPGFCRPGLASFGRTSLPRVLPCAIGKDRVRVNDVGVECEATLRAGEQYWRRRGSHYGLCWPLDSHWCRDSRVPSWLAITGSVKGFSVHVRRQTKGGSPLRYS